MTAFLLLVVLCGVVLSAVYTAGEIAVVAVNRLRLRHLARQGVSAAKRGVRIVSQVEVYLTTALVGLNLANTMTAVAATAVVRRYSWPPSAAGKTALFVAAGLAFLFLAELLPKAVVRLRPTLFLLALARILRWSHVLFRPACAVVEAIMRRAPGGGVSRQELRREEIEALLRSSEGRGVLPEFRGKGAPGLLSFHRVTVREVMTPRPQVVSLRKHAPPQELLEAVRRFGFTRIPVCASEGGNYVGLVNVFDFLFRVELPACIGDLLREAPVVSAGDSAWEVLVRFQATPHRMAFVADEGNRHIGIITVEDLIEEILGEIREELP